jgi:hypothetical protein
MEYAEQRMFWNLFSPQFGREFGEVYRRIAPSAHVLKIVPQPASGYLIVDRTVKQRNSQSEALRLARCGDCSARVVHRSLFIEDDDLAAANFGILYRA